MKPPKYNIGDTIWFLGDKSVISGIVSGVQTSPTDFQEGQWAYSIATPYKPISMGYSYPEIKHSYTHEIFCFPSKEELLASL